MAAAPQGTPGDAHGALGDRALVALHSLQVGGFNGKRGMVHGPAPSEGRWLVTLEGGGEYRIRPENLKRIDAGDLARAKEGGTWRSPRAAPRTKALDKYYGADPDGYNEMRKQGRREGDIKSCNFDHALYKAMAASLNELGHITTDKWRNEIWREVADGSGGRPQLTCNERWTLRFGLGDFSWDSDARSSVLLDLPTRLNVMGVTAPPAEVQDPRQILELLRGPTLEELGSRPAKRAKSAEGAPGPQSRRVWVDGMYLDREMLIAAREGVADDNVIDALEAMKIVSAVSEDGKFTRCERWTLRFVLSAYVFTDAAFNFLKEACFKLEQTNDLLP